MDKELRFYLNSNVYLARVIPATNKSIKCYNFKYELQKKSNMRYNVNIFLFINNNTCLYTLEQNYVHPILLMK